MILRAFSGGPLGAIGYLVSDEPGGRGLIIDAPPSTAARIVASARRAELELIAICITHGHWEQFADAAEISLTLPAPVLAHQWDATRLSNPALTMDEPGKYKVSPCRAELHASDGDLLAVGSLSFVVMHTPGHSPGSISLYLQEQGALFTGDLLMKSAVGSFRHPGGDVQQLEASLQRLAALPDNTRVYPGHGGPTTIGNERWLLQLAESKPT